MEGKAGKSKYGLLTRPPKACPQRWGNAEWTFAVPLSVSLYMAPYHRQKGWQRSRNVERFRIWQMSKPFKFWNANASDVNWTFFDHWLTFYLQFNERYLFFFAKTLILGSRKSLVRDIMRHSPVSFTFAKRERRPSPALYNNSWLQWCGLFQILH